MSWNPFPMITPELGAKRVCVGCAARFYDLQRVPAVCPKCSAVQPPVKPRPPSLPRGGMRGRVFVPVAVAAVEAEPDVLIEEVDEDVVDDDEDVDEEKIDIEVAVIE